MLESVDEPLFDGGADVAGDAPDAGQLVPEPLGLGGRLGGPRLLSQVLWVWRRSWKCIPGTIGEMFLGRVAVDGWPPGAAVEAGAA